MKIGHVYAGIIGAAFLFGVGFTLITDLLANAPSLETLHKVIHVGFGVWGLTVFFKKLNPMPFVWTNVVLWGLFAIIGWTLPGFLGLKAFEQSDAILHTIVSATGIVAVLYGKKQP